MTVDSVIETVKQVNVAMGMGCEVVPTETAGTGKPASDCKPDDPVQLPGFLHPQGTSDNPLGLGTGFCGGRMERSRCKIVHSQLLRIRKEDHRLGEDDVRDRLGARENVAFVQVSTGMSVLYYARPILPSPLGTKAPIN